MRKYWRLLAKLLGVQTWYHVHSVGDKRTVSGTYRLTPWLHHGNYSELQQFIAIQLDTEKDHVVMISITRIGS